MVAISPKWGGPSQLTDNPFILLENLFYFGLRVPFLMAKKPL
jgi:hypothetical protein